MPVARPKGRQRPAGAQRERERERVGDASVSMVIRAAEENLGTVLRDVADNVPFPCFWMFLGER